MVRRWLDGRSYTYIIRNEREADLFVLRKFAIQYADFLEDEKTVPNMGTVFVWKKRMGEQLSEI